MKCQRGFSLVEVLVGLAVVVLVIYSGSTAIREVSRNYRRANTVTDLDTLRHLDLSRSFKGDKIAEAINFSAQARACLLGAGVNCNSDSVFGFSQAGWQRVEALSRTSAVGSVTVQSEVKYHPRCSATACSGIDIQFVTQPVNVGEIQQKEKFAEQFAKREVIKFLPAYSLVSRAFVEGSCPSGTEVVTGLDMGTQKIVCQPVAVSGSCDSLGPLLSLGATQATACQPLARDSCPNGFQEVDLFGDSDSCVGGAPRVVCGRSTTCEGLDLVERDCYGAEVTRSLGDISCAGGSPPPILQAGCYVDTHKFDMPTYPDCENEYQCTSTNYITFSVGDVFSRDQYKFSSIADYSVVWKAMRWPSMTPVACEPSPSSQCVFKGGNGMYRANVDITHIPSGKTWSFTMTAVKNTLMRAPQACPQPL